MVHLRTYLLPSSFTRTISCLCSSYVRSLIGTGTLLLHGSFRKRSLSELVIYYIMSVCLLDGDLPLVRENPVRRPSCS